MYEAIERMETMALMVTCLSRIPVYQIRKMISTAIHLISTWARSTPPKAAGGG
ncbi:MAG: hypothetical protein M5R40_07370 [Anaerolineae bacterium]|nr:hypothetical protein [Anaerolineae bacterium]